MASTSVCINVDVEMLSYCFWQGELGFKVLCRCLAQNKLSRNVTNYKGTLAFLVAE